MQLCSLTDSSLEVTTQHLEEIPLLKWQCSFEAAMICSFFCIYDILWVSVQDTEFKLFVVSLRHKVRGDPCMGVLCLRALNFGGDVGGKSSVRGFIPASSGVHISQCVHFTYCF